MNTKSTKLATLLFAFAITAAACGSDAEEAASVAGDAVGDAAGEVLEATDEILTPDEDAMDDAMDEDAMDDDAASDVPGTVVDIALSSPEFSTLVAALTEADLVDTLEGDGPFTVFAPTNDAFDDLFDATGITAEQLLATTDLPDTLTYHVVDGVLLAETALLADGTSILTLEGSGLAIDIVAGDVILNDETTVITADIVAANGVVHVIDGVLLPDADS